MSKEQSPPVRKVIPYKGGRRKSPFADMALQFSGTALDVAQLRRPIVPGPTALLKLMTAPLTLLPSPPLTPDAIDFINQPATVDMRPLLERMPRRLTPLAEGLGSYLAPDAGPGIISWSAD